MKSVPLDTVVRKSSVKPGLEKSASRLDGPFLSALLSQGHAQTNASVSVSAASRSNSVPRVSNFQACRQLGPFVFVRSSSLTYEVQSTVRAAEGKRVKQQKVLERITPSRAEFMNTRSLQKQVYKPVEVSTANHCKRINLLEEPSLATTF
jgi:hypothetical protein